jgi:hypothetical protein
MTDVNFNCGPLLLFQVSISQCRVVHDSVVCYSFKVQFVLLSKLRFALLQDLSSKPQCMRTLAIKRGVKSVAVSCIAVHEDLEHLAVGLYDGTVLYYHGNISRERATNRNARVVYEAPQDQTRSPITHLSFVQAEHELLLYFATIDRMWTCCLSRDDQPRAIYTTAGCDYSAAAMDDKNTSLYAVIKDKSRSDDQVRVWSIVTQRISFLSSLDTRTCSNLMV